MRESRSLIDFWIAISTRKHCTFILDWNNTIITYSRMYWSISLPAKHIKGLRLFRGGGGEGGGEAEKRPQESEWCYASVNLLITNKYHRCALEWNENISNCISCRNLNMSASLLLNPLRAVRSFSLMLSYCCG